MAQPKGPAGEILPSAAYVLGWCEFSTTPAAVVTRDQGILWANNAGRDLISSGLYFRKVRGRISCVDSRQEPDLKAFVRDLAEPRVWAYRGNEDHILVRGDLTVPAGLVPAVGLSFFVATPAAEYLWADLSKIFGLTAAEASIIKRLVHGERVDNLAEALELSVETVRTHIRRSYVKLGVGSREELFSAVSPFRIR